MLVAPPSPSPSVSAAASSSPSPSASPSVAPSSGPGVVLGQHMVPASQQTIGNRTVWQLKAREFGFAVASAGDLDGNGREDLLVSAPGAQEGSAHVLLMPVSGTVPMRTVELMNGANGIPLDTFEAASRAFEQVAGIGDLDRDGVPDVLVGAPLDHRVLFDRRARVLLNDESGGYDDDYDDDDYSQRQDDDASGSCTAWMSCGGPGSAAVLFMRPNGTARQVQKLSGIDGKLGIELDYSAAFGSSLALIRAADTSPPTSTQAPATAGPSPSPSPTRAAQLQARALLGFVPQEDDDDDDDNSNDDDGGVPAVGEGPAQGHALVAVGAPRQSGRHVSGCGALVLLGLRSNGTVSWERQISDGRGGFPTGVLTTSSRFGQSAVLVRSAESASGPLAASLSTTGSGRAILAVGAPGHQGGDGAVFLLSMEGPAWTVFGVTTLARATHALDGHGGRSFPRYGYLGASLTNLGDLDGDGFPEIAVGRGTDRNPSAASRRRQLLTSPSPSTQTPSPSPLTPSPSPQTPSPSPQTPSPSVSSSVHPTPSSSPLPPGDPAVVIMSLNYSESAGNVTLRSTRDISSLDTSWLPVPIDESVVDFGAGLAGLGNYMGAQRVHSVLAVGEPGMGRVHLLSLESPFNDPVPPTPAPSSTPDPTPLPNTPASDPAADGAARCDGSIGGRPEAAFDPAQLVLSLTFTLPLGATSSFDCNAAHRFADIFLRTTFGSSPPAAMVYFQVVAAARRATSMGPRGLQLQGEREARVTILVAVEHWADADDAYAAAVAAAQGGEIDGALQDDAFFSQLERSPGSSGVVVLEVGSTGVGAARDVVGNLASDPDGSSPAPENELSGGAIAGIVIAAVLVLGIGAAAALYLCDSGAGEAPAQRSGSRADQDGESAGRAGRGRVLAAKQISVSPVPGPSGAPAAAAFV